MLLLVALVVMATRARREAGRAREARTAADTALLTEIEAHTRATRHAIKGLTAALGLEERARALRIPDGLDGEPPPAP